MNLIVIDKTMIAQDVVRLRLAPEGAGQSLDFEPGAHLEFRFGPYTRRYSLTSEARGSSWYEIMVLRSSAGRGGSVYLHDTLAVGDTVTSIGVANAFPLAVEATKTLLIAGGIGITPFLSMARALHDAGADYALHYAAQSAERCVPLPDWLLPRARFYIDVAGSAALDVAALLAPVERATHLYVCGPVGLIAAVRTLAAALGFPQANVHFEAFGASWLSTDQPLRIRLTQSAMTIAVAPGTTILDALIENGIWAPSECLAGRCATCLTEVVAGEPLHRDALIREQRGSAMCTCVSWAVGPDLALAL